MARIRCVVHFNAELDILAFFDAGVLDKTEIRIADAVCPKCVAADITDTDATIRRQGPVKRCPACCKQFRYGHSRRIQCCRLIGPDGLADQSINAAQSAGRVRAVQHCERCTGLERDKRVKLPATE